MNRLWIMLLVFLGVLVVPGVLRVEGIEIFTSAEVEAVNGSDVRLKCTFNSKEPVRLQTVSVSWNFRPLKPGPEESVFYYQEAPFPPLDGRFKGHAVWSGDILKQDASITLHEVPPTFNGTYVCQVRNTPDVHGQNGETVLKVVEKATLSEIGLLAAIVGGAIGVVLILLAIFVAVRICKRSHADEDFEGPHTIEKDPTLW